MRRKVIWVITCLGGLFYLAEFLLPAKWPGRLVGSEKAIENPLTQALPTVTNLLIVVGTMAFLLGLMLGALRLPYQNVLSSSYDTLFVLAAGGIGLISVVLLEKTALSRLSE